MRSPAEPTIRDLLSDPLILSVMKADRVDAAALEEMLHSLAPGVQRNRQASMPSRMPPASARTFCPTGCAW